jgi:hypothetical protein
MEIDKLTVQKRGRLGEKLVEAYINDDLIPSLKKTEGWTDIIYTVAWFKATYPQKDYEDFIKFEEEKQTRLLLANGFYPTKEFADYFNKLVDCLSNTPDGFLIKMKRNGAFRKVKQAVEEYNLTSKIQLEDFDGNKFLQLPKENEKLPVVDGKIEVVEVKTGKGNQLQVDSYRNAVANGYSLRLFKVDLKVPQIWEKVIVNPNEVVLNCFKDLNTFAKGWSI